MLPAAKRGPHTNGLSPPNGRSTPVIRKLADEVLYRVAVVPGLVVVGISLRDRTSALREKQEPLAKQASAREKAPKAAGLSEWRWVGLSRERNTVEGMSQNLELVKAMLPQPDADWSRLMRDEDAFALMRETLGPCVTDDFESVVVAPSMNVTYPGLDGLRKNWLDWLEPWASYRVTIDELIEVGSRVVVLSRNYGRPAEIENEVELIAAAIVTFTEGKISRWEDYAVRAAALEAVGLTL